MPNRSLSPAELQNADALLADIRERLKALAEADGAAAAFKALKRRSQKGICPRGDDPPAFDELLGQ